MYLPAGATLALSRAEIAVVVRALAHRIAPRVDSDTVVVCLLTGAIWFAADLMRELALLGANPLFDVLWLASYGDARTSRGRVEVRSTLTRPVLDRHVLVVDDVLDSGLSLATASRLFQAAGAASVRTAVFARKPWSELREIEADYVGWEAPAGFLVGYGMDAAGRYRGAPDILVMD